MKIFSAWRATILLCVLLLGSWESAPDAAVRETWDVPSLVRVAPRRSAASTREVLDLDLALRPQSTPSDVLRSVPGLLIAQHAGGGKADQLFLRGFDADHGTDVAIFADQIPVNTVSHAHGQGYADMHFLIPETIERIDALKGAYLPEQGDLAVAGTVNIHLYETLPRTFVDLSGGSFQTARAVAGARLPHVLESSYLTLEGYRTDGPFDNRQNFRRVNAFWKGTQPLTPDSKLILLVSSFASDWHASGQIPEREVQAGRLSRFGSIDPTEGGKTERQNAAAAYHKEWADRHQLLTEIYAFRYQLQLFSNFTFFMDDPVRGDGIEQDDHRTAYGGHFRYAYNLPTSHGDLTTSVGVQMRGDEVRAELWRQQQRSRISQVRGADILERSASLYWKEEIPMTSRFRFVGGLRYDRFQFESDGGVGNDSIISPKGNLIYAVTSRTDLFLNSGTGFHSNDARLASANPMSGLIRARTVEIGTRHQTPDGAFSTSLSVWAIDLDSELAFAGDTGTTDAKGRSRRSGIECEWRYRFLPWLWADLDLNLSQAKFRDTSQAVPLAPNQLITAGLSARHPAGYEGAFRVRQLGSRWGIEDRSVSLPGYAVFDTLIGYRRERWGVTLTLENITNTEWREAQFVFPSRLSFETAPVQDIHFTPGIPRQALASLKLYF